MAILMPFQTVSWCSHWQIMRHPLPALRGVSDRPESAPDPAFAPRGRRLAERALERAIESRLGLVSHLEGNACDRVPRHLQPLRGDLQALSGQITHRCITHDLREAGGKS